MLNVYDPGCVQKARLVARFSVRTPLGALGRLDAEGLSFCPHQVCVLYAVWGRIPWLPL